MPTKAHLKNNYNVPIMVNFTLEQKQALEEYAQSRGLSMASFIRYEILKEVFGDAPQMKPANKLAKFAGVLDDQTAQKMLNDIYQDRVNTD